MAGAAAAAPAAPAKPAFDPSVVALLSLAWGSLAAAAASILVFLGKFEPWQIPIFLVGVMLVISAPSMAIAWLKLRKRNLGPILDANGWAVNAKAKMNVPFGGALTGVASLPVGATFGAADAFAEKRSPWPRVLVAAFVIWFIWAFLNDSQGRLYTWTDGKVGIPPLSVREQLAKEKLDAAKAAKDAKAKADAAAGIAPSVTTNVPAAVTTNMPAK